MAKIIVEMNGCTKIRHRQFYTTSIIYIHKKPCYSIGRKEKDMTAIIRLFSLNSEHRYAQLEKKELGYDCVRPFKDRLERMNCVNEPGWS